VAKETGAAAASGLARIGTMGVKLSQMLGTTGSFSFKFPQPCLEFLRHFNIFTFDFDAIFGPACFVGWDFRNLLWARILFPLVIFVFFLVAHVLHNRVAGCVGSTTAARLSQTLGLTGRLYFPLYHGARRTDVQMLESGRWVALGKGYLRQCELVCWSDLVSHVSQVSPVRRN